MVMKFQRMETDSILTSLVTQFSYTIRYTIRQEMWLKNAMFYNGEVKNNQFSFFSFWPVMESLRIQLQ